MKQNLKNLADSISNLGVFLDENYLAYNQEFNISSANPDPLLIARQYKNHKYFAEIALFCALMSYGSAKQIVKFLARVDFDKYFVLDSTSSSKPLLDSNLYYRFQNANDVYSLLMIFREIIAQGGIKKLFYHSLKPSHTRIDIIYSILFCIDFMQDIAVKASFTSAGLDFAIGKNKRFFNPKNHSALKRWNMFLRWMVRSDNIDFGIWEGINKSQLIIPLDTHTFRVSKALGLLNRKTPDLEAALELSQALGKFCAIDPIKYDFALYRIGQSLDV